MRLGVDVGGTHTDAVLIDNDVLLAKHKTLTSPDITSGVLASVRAVLKAAGVRVDMVQMLTVGTTQFTNAVVERRRLTPVGVLRIGAQSSSALPIAAKWPDTLKQAAIGCTRMIDGGHEFDGQEIVPMDQKALASAVADFRNAGVTSIAITSVFATANAKNEIDAADFLCQVMPEAKIALSHRLGRIGLYQRENATILNASLLPLANDVINAFRRAFEDLSVRCPFFVSQNDGTLMEAGYAALFPVLTFSSGPTNSMRGAAWLSKRDNAMVVDVGGTTSDVGMLIDAFPRQSGTAVKIGGVLTNFRMPDVLALGLGGGSVVDDDGRVLGPASVGHRLTTEALVFGGDQLTASDIGVASGRVSMGDPARVGALDRNMVQRAQATIKTMLAQTIDQMKTSAAALPLIVVGGGGFLVPDDLPGVSAVVRPADGDVANAIGAAFAQVSGEGEAVFSTRSGNREDALEAATKMARQRAIAAGAIADSLTVANLTETPMTYTDEPGATICVRMIGDVHLTAPSQGGADQC
ncbi:MAG: hydantoinase/oxoprolinase family protein [Pseudomonadota bacterium]